MEEVEKKQFDAEVGKVLHLMIHSLYTNKEIFLRELISNASDACDKLRYLSQSDNSIKLEDPNFKITIQADTDSRILTIRDNGIGMNKEDLISHLGTIARSGTQNFLSNMSGDSKKDNMLIGQFGVGFYSSFMIADKVVVTSKKINEDQAYCWESAGTGEYTLYKFNEEFKTGTEIKLHIKEGEDKFLDHFHLKNVIKTYSDHIAIPIYYIEQNENEVKINSSSALWCRPKNEISKEQYQELYKSVSFSMDEPWLTMHNKNEGQIEFTNLLFIPSTKTFDLYHPDRRRRVKLYIKRVFITDENIDLIPQYLRFLRGVVDSEDLPLNISRETLQHNAILEQIKDSITKRVLSQLKKKKDESLEDYITYFWNNFAGAFKEGLCEATPYQEKILDNCLFVSALQNKLISFDDYIANCKDDQKTIYYLSGDDANKLRTNPQIEGFLTKGIDVLLFTDTVDDFWVNVNTSYKGYEIKSVTRSDINLEDTSTDKAAEQNQNDEKYAKLTEYCKNVLQDLVIDVKISHKLTSSPACLSVAEGAMDIRMERFLIEQKQLAKSSAKIFEINPNHNVFKKVYNDLITQVESEENSNLIKLIFDQACIMEGEAVPDVAAFSQRMSEFLQKIVLAA